MFYSRKIYAESCWGSPAKISRLGRSVLFSDSLLGLTHLHCRAAGKGDKRQVTYVINALNPQGISAHTHFVGHQFVAVCGAIAARRVSHYHFPYGQFFNKHGSVVRPCGSGWSNLENTELRLSARQHRTHRIQYVPAVHARAPDGARLWQPAL